jgi:hypothetical protein
MNLTYIQLQEYINQFNLTEGRTHKPPDPKYKLIADRIYRLRKKYNKLKMDDEGKVSKFVEQDLYTKITQQQILNDIRLWIKERNKYSSLNKSKRNIRIVYTRYADDWIIVTNSKLKKSSQKY